MSKARFALIAILAVYPVGQSFAYNAAAHKIAAEIAWQKLSDNQRQAIVAVLRKHPRFQSDFENEMPPQVAAQAAEIDHWILRQAAIWPDMARDLPDFHHGRWHYINLPLFLSAQQGANLQGHIHVNTSFSLPADAGVDNDDDNLNGVQAVKHSLLIVNSPSVPVSIKAVHYCWLFHVIPDLSQPLHSAALFTENVFPDGDHGGNSIKIRPAGESGGSKKLHAVWDGLLGTDSSFNSIRSRANEIMQSHQGAYNAPFLGMPDDVWATESQAVAAQTAYSDLLPKIQNADSHGHHLGVIEVDDRYFTKAGETIRRQVDVAGVRLAGVLASTTPVSGGATALAFSAPGLEHHGMVAVAPTGVSSESPDVVSPMAESFARQGNSQIEARLARLEAAIAELNRQLTALKSANVSISETPAYSVHGSFDAGEEDQCDCGESE